MLSCVLAVYGCASTGADASRNAASAAGLEVGTLQAVAAQSAQAGDFGQAIAIYQRMTAAEPGRAEVWFLLGGALLRNQQPEPAQRAFEQALRLDPKLSKAYANLALTHLAQFREAASRAIGSDQVSDANRVALRLLLRDVDQALFPARELPKTDLKP